ncbi:Hypothetical predicted protein [Pelobates cultripes]|uniref:Uncharacterized protein n=1 Tax=Pelobates cultripes TaxID=61616 RepID=A0AAD1W206_PELCU|nr:Hypothetical predicted protein [Pelobates cultripes]
MAAAISRDARLQMAAARMPAGMGAALCRCAATEPARRVKGGQERGKVSDGEIRRAADFYRGRDIGYAAGSLRGRGKKES